MIKKLVLISLFLYADAQNIAKMARPMTRMPQSALAASLGNASTALPRHAASFFYNPASIVGLNNSMLNMGIQDLSLDRKVYLISFYKPLRNNVFFSVGFIQSTVSKLYEYDIEGVRGDAISFNDNMVYLSGGFRLFKKLNFALSVNHLFDNISSNQIKDYESKSTGIDIGLLYSMGYQTYLGMTVKNINGIIKTNSDKSDLFEEIHEEEIPKVITFGLKSGILNRFIDIAHIDVYADFKYNEHLENTSHFGVQIKARSIPFRLGSNNGELTYGLGLHFRVFNKTIAMNYAYVPSLYNESNNHLFDWSLIF